MFEFQYIILDRYSSYYKMTWRYEKLMEISNDIEFISGHSLTNFMNSHDLKNVAAGLELKYN